MVTEEERQWMWSEYAPDPRMRLNLGIRRRLAPLLDNNHQKILLANALLYALPGAPIIYYGDEIGMGDNIWLFDRNGVRTPMQWDDSINAGFSEANPEDLYAPVIDSPEYTYKKVNVGVERKDPDSLLNKMKLLISVRKSHPIFAVGDFEFLAQDQTSFLAILRTFEDQNVICIHNLTREEKNLELDLSNFSGKRLINLLKEGEMDPITKEKQSFDLQPHQFLWMMITD
jgi:maltose alpha-D-glucosyltransferase/alpha-amylase